MDQFENSFINVRFSCRNESTSEMPTERRTLQKIRTVPNILKRKRSTDMDFPRSIKSTSIIRRNIEMKKQIFDPVRSELLTWENNHSSKPVMLNVDIIDHMHFGKKQKNEIELNLSEYSPMWCPTSSETHASENAIKIIETVTVNSPIGEITNSICAEFVQPEFHEFQREMNKSIPEVKNIDVETVIELGRFERYATNDHLQALEQKDPFDEIVIRNSWSKFECLMCEKIYRSQTGLNYHLKVKHHRVINASSNPVIVLTCPRCFKIFKTYSGYDRHMIRCNIATQLREE